jgi:hypothetical protein
MPPPTATLISEVMDRYFHGDCMYLKRIDTYNCQLNLGADNKYILYVFNMGLMKSGIYINQVL